MADPVQLREPYREAGQQHAADMLGAYVFLASEIMLFGGLFAVVFALRLLHGAEIVAASARLHLWIGGLNTAILLTSSLVVALAVHAARGGRAGRAAALLLAAAGLGLVFLGVKGFEYSWEQADGLLPYFSDPARFSGPVEQLFMDVYLVATGLHAVHVTVGIVLLAGLAGRLVRKGAQVATVEVTGLYWHLVDVIWIFLYPVLYLAR